MRVPVGVRVGVFALIVMGGYTYFANSIPQIESKPPQELSLEGGNVTPAQLVKAGEEIFHTKGSCEICHRIGQKGTRAPDLAGIGARAGKTKPGMSAKAYILESLLQPQAYVLEGYPPIMPAVDKPPIALNRSEVWALVAFLESLGGTVDVTLNDIPATVGAGGAGGDQGARRSQGGQGRLHGEGHVPGVSQGRRHSGRARGSRPLADRQDPDARLHPEEDPGPEGLGDGGQLSARRDAAGLRHATQRQGVRGPRGVPPDAQVTR